MKKIGEPREILYVLLILLMVIGSFWFFIDLAKFPACYVTTVRYGLQTDIQRGDPSAIEYYEENYVSKGRVLFD